MVTMTFNGHNLFKEFGVLVNQRTTFLPPLRRRQFEVDGRDGLVEFSNNVFDMRTLLVECFMYDPKRIIEKQRQLAGLLSQRGRISFSDEPELHYIGRVYGGADLVRLDHRARTFELSFECEPFLIGAVRGVTGIGGAQLAYAGTARTPMRISITNTGSAPINGITITHSIVEQGGV